MTRLVDRNLDSLRELALRMGSLSEAILAKSLRALRERDPQLASEVKADDLDIDRLDIEIDDCVLEVLALQAPVAVDLREVVAIKTMATDLERVGDLARNIAKSAARLSERTAIPLPPRLDALGEDSRRLLRRSLDAFAERDPIKAREVLAGDDAIDRDEDIVIQEAIRDVQQQPDTAAQEVDFMFVARNLERVADHATNIAEDVILLAEAKNLKHAAKLTG